MSSVRNRSWIPGVRHVLAKGPLATTMTVATVAVGIPVLLARGLERRTPRLRDDFVAWLVGDPALAIAAGLAVGGVRGDRTALPEPRTVLASAPAAWVFPAGFLAFGFWQLRREEAVGLYSAEQSVAPTKLYHQFVTYPMLGALVSGPVVELFGGDSRGLVRKAAVLGFLSVWGLGLVYDASHPKLGHAPVRWRGLAPAPLARPWPTNSITLRVNNSKHPNHDLEVY